MSRVYAGILGPLAMAVVICRGWLGSGGVDGTLWLATIYLVVFSVGTYRASRPNDDRRICSLEAGTAIGWEG